MRRQPSAARAPDAAEGTASAAGRSNIGFYRVARPEPCESLQSKPDSTMACCSRRRPVAGSSAASSLSCRCWRFARAIRVGGRAGIDAARRRRLDLRGVRACARHRLGRSSRREARREKLPYRVVNASITGTRRPADGRGFPHLLAHKRRSSSSSSAATTACAAATSRPRATT